MRAQPAQGAREAGKEVRFPLAPSRGLPLPLPRARVELRRWGEKKKRSLWDCRETQPFNGENGCAGKETSRAPLEPFPDWWKAGVGVGGSPGRRDVKPREGRGQGAASPP